MTSNERSNRCRFLEGAVCAGLQIPPRRLQFQWDYSWLHVKFRGDNNALSYNELHRMVTALDALGFQTESGQIVIYSDLSFTIRFFDPFDDIINQHKQQ